jgi:hypothetical protein
MHENFTPKVAGAHVHHAPCRKNGKTNGDEEEASYFMDATFVPKSKLAPVLPSKTQGSPDEPSNHPL